MSIKSVTEASHRRWHLWTAVAAFLVVIPQVAIGLDVGPPTTPKAVGTENRKWITGPETPQESPPIYSYTEQDNVFVTMRDGVQLWTHLYIPVLASGASAPPCVLMSDGYGAFLDPFFTPTLVQLAKRGYAVVFAKLRGTPPSQGVAGLYNDYGTDGYDLVEWMAKQGWCNGDVGMVGASLLGISQWLTAKEAPPHLRVVLPDDANSNTYWYLWYPGGMLPGPGRAARQFIPGAEAEYPLAIAHRNYDEFWRERTMLQEDMAQIAHEHIPALLSSGWDSYMLGSAKSFGWLDSGGAANREKIIIGPQGHNGFFFPGPVSSSIHPFSGFDYEVLWLDRWLKGIHNGVDNGPRALLYVQGPNQWRFENSWPIPDEHRIRLFLNSAVSGTGVSLNDGSLSDEQRAARATPVSYHYSPSGPYNAASVTGTTRLTFDQSPYEAHGLTWTSEPLADPTEMTGYANFNFWASSTAADTDFVVQITDVSPPNQTGHSVSSQVTRGYLNGPHYFSASVPEPLLSGNIYNFAMELYPTSYVFAAGHRIRVSLQGSAIDPTLNVAWQGPGLNPNPATVMVYQDATHPSHIDLPVIGTGWKALATGTIGNGNAGAGN
jgi:predicted acyl esterase